MKKYSLWKDWYLMTNEEFRDFIGELIADVKDFNEFQDYMEGYEYEYRMETYSENRVTNFREAHWREKLVDIVICTRTANRHR